GVGVMIGLAVGMATVSRVTTGAGRRAPGGGDGVGQGGEGKGQSCLSGRRSCRSRCENGDRDSRGWKEYCKAADTGGGDGFKASFAPEGAGTSQYWRYGSLSLALRWAL